MGLTFDFETQNLRPKGSQKPVTRRTKKAKPKQPILPARDYLTVKETSERLGITASLVTRYCREGRFDKSKAVGAISLGKQWVVMHWAIEEFEKIPRERGNPNFGKAD